MMKVVSCRGNCYVKKTKLVLKTHKNNSGTISWRINGWVFGERVRKNYKDKQKALAEKSAMEMRALQSENGGRPAGTFIGDEQLREAESLFLRIKDFLQNILPTKAEETTTASFGEIQRLGLRLPKGARQIANVVPKIGA